MKNFNVMLIALTMVVVACWTGKAQVAEPHMLYVTGNSLYARCQRYQENVRNTDDGIEVRNSASASDAYDAGFCDGYTTGLVESRPTGKYFDPRSGLHQNQYVDIVTGYLRDHPELRQEYAYGLAV